MNRIKKLVYAAGLAMGMAGGVQAADIVFIVDESGSMAGEHAWLGSMVTSLETNLVAAGETTNQYGLVGFGGHVSGQLGHAHPVGGGDWGTTAASLSAAAGSLVVSGGFEDGWQAIDFALNHYSFSGGAVNFILVTDEDRDNGASLTYAGMESSLTSAGVLLNVVVNGNLRATNEIPTAGTQAVGVDSDGNAYVADGSGGYTTAAAGLTTGYGTTVADYMDLAWATGGAAWDLNQLRAGGLTADSFTAAFVDIKVQEIIEQTGSVPEPASLALMGIGLLGMGFGRKVIKSRIH